MVKTRSKLVTKLVKRPGQPDQYVRYEPIEKSDSKGMRKGGTDKTSKSGERNKARLTETAGSESSQWPQVTVKGETFAMVPLADLEALQDAADHTRAMAAIDDGEETFPDEVVKRLLDGDNPVRVYREYRGMSVADLVKATDLSQSYISQIETGKRAVKNVDTLRALASALGVDMDDLI